MAATAETPENRPNGVLTDTDGRTVSAEFRLPRLSDMIVDVRADPAKFALLRIAISREVTRRNNIFGAPTKHGAHR